MIIKDDVSHTHSLPLTLYVITWTTGKLFTNVIKKKRDLSFLKVVTDEKMYVSSYDLKSTVDYSMTQKML